MNVLSLFDGISCARVALDRAGIEVNAYMSAEIEKNAIKISDKNYPDIIRVGSVVGLEVEGQVDLLIGGSPCQDLSIAKKDRKGLGGDRSGLFWEYVRLKNECKPTYFILENVASMPKKDKDIITREMGVEPVMFNASLVSAQSRKRLFWTNIPFTLPEDKGILLKDILQPDGEVDERMLVKGGKSACIDANYHKGSSVDHSIRKKVRTMVKTAQTGRNETKKLGYVNDKDHQANRVYDDNGKLPALASVCNSMVKIGYIGEGEQYGQGGQAHRVYSTEGKTPTLSSGPALILSKHQQTNLREVDEKAHTLCATMWKGSHANGTTLIKVGHIGTSDGQANRVYDTEGKSVTLSANGGGLGAKTGLYKVGREIGRRLDENGTRADHSDNPIQRRIETREDDKCGTLTSVTKDNLVVGDRIRKLTPIECERLQGLPDNYTEGIAMTNRYKCLGNAFNVDVVTHILSHLK